MQQAAFLSAWSTGEYSHESTQSIYTEETPISLPLITQIYADKPQNSINRKQTVFLCVIMQPAAFLCVLCAICGRITRKSTLSISTNETPKSPADLADLRRRNPKQQNILYLKRNCLSLRNNAACCIPLRHLRYLRENIHPNLLNQSTQEKPQYLPQISLIHADKQQNSLNLTNLSFSAW